MFCEKCGAEISSNDKFCPGCGSPVQVVSVAPPQEENMRCLPAFILGLGGSIFGMFGGICTTMCSMSSRAGNSAFFMIFVGAIIGLIGACMCLKKPRTGSLLEALSAILMIIRAYSGSGATFSVVIGILFMLAGAIIGIIYAFVIKRK